ncbi:MAG: helix-turn-helix transcriptional regulator [Elusimicrobia bacterium]|nr:helix-turn-helix transcriptional regulator [Elusimicrobiota bacterium]
MSSKSFVRIITSRMKEKNIGVRQLARECGIDASFISKVIQGKRNPPTSEKIIEKLAAVLLIDPTMLTIYTGRIPSTLQLVLENESFVNDLLRNISSPRVNIPPSVRRINADKKIYQKSEITDELL